MKVFLFGHYHTKNFGDKLLRDKALLEILNNPKVDNVIYPKVEEWASMSKLGKLLYGTTQVLKSDVMIMAGGGYINCDSGTLGWLKLLRYFVPCLVATLLQKPYILAAVGVGPNLFGIGRLLARFIFNHAEQVAVRDQESEDLVRDIGVSRDIKQTSDGALCINYDTLYQKGNRFKLSDGRLKIVFHLLLRGGEHKNVENLINRICKKYAGKADFVFFSDNGLLGTERTKFRCQQSEYNIEVVEDINTGEVIEFLKTANVIFTTKLHISIVGYCLGSLVFSFARHGKTQRFYKQIGKFDNCVSLNSIDDKTLTQWEVQIDRLIEQGNVDYDTTKQNELVMKSKNNYSLIEEFLNRSA